jgi:mono/diheme cytochrome c family protein
MRAGIFCRVAMCILLGYTSVTAADPSTTFARKCSSCHTFGRGVLVGPDLKGATDRHNRQWLTAWITSSETLIKSGDPAATALFARFKSQRMPDQGLTPSELSALIDYLAASGPEADARRKSRRADTATPLEIETGRSLFTGQRALANGGAACFSCHRAGGIAAGGTLGPDLSGAYARYQDRGLSALLTRGCFPRARASMAPTLLTDDETFALKAFLRRTAEAR